jgi:histone H3/H4
MTLTFKKDEAQMEENYWRKCGSCKKEIGFNTIYQKCSVSTCNKLAFCSVKCWDMHVPILNHKSAWAEEERSPSKSAAVSETNSQTPVRRIIVNASNTSTPSTTSKSTSMDQEILIVASKLKQYVKEKYDLNTSANVMEALSDEVRRITDRAAAKAIADGRKTLMDRDF